MLSSLCHDCFHNGNHQEHDVNMIRDVEHVICDCGDITMMNSKGFCKQHGPSRIPNGKSLNDRQRSMIDFDDQAVSWCSGLKPYHIVVFV